MNNDIIKIVYEYIPYRLDIEKIKFARNEENDVLYYINSTPTFLHIRRVLELDLNPQTKFNIISTFIQDICVKCCRNYIRTGKILPNTNSYLCTRCYEEYLEKIAKKVARGCSKFKKVPKYPVSAGWNTEAGWWILNEDYERIVQKKKTKMMK